MDTIRTIAAMLVLAAAGSAVAQPQAANRPCAAASGASSSLQGCGGPVPHAHWGKDYTAGWPMMTPEERQAHRNQMSSFTSHDECKAYVDRHHEEMVARAKEQGRPAPAQPRREACAPLKGKAAK